MQQSFAFSNGQTSPNENNKYFTDTMVFIKHDSLKAPLNKKIFHGIFEFLKSDNHVILMIFYKFNKKLQNFVANHRKGAKIPSLLL